MATKRNSGLQRTVAVAFFLLFLLYLPQQIYGAITPEREIVPIDSINAPGWKNYWDAARQFARNGQYTISAEYYKEVLLQKPQIEEARWEYCKVLYKIHRFDEAGTHLEQLIEINPYKQDYLAMAGYVFYEKTEYTRAVEFLGQVYAQRPEGEEGLKTLQYMVESLKKLDKKEILLPLMEQLFQRTPDNRILKIELAELYDDLGMHSKAVELYSDLIADQNTSTQLLLNAEQLFSRVNKEDLAAQVWGLLAMRGVSETAQREKLLSYYSRKAEPQKKIDQIDLLLGKVSTERQISLLLLAARTSRAELGREDKAISYYEQYLLMVPHDKDVASELDSARVSVAQQLQVIVEHNGVKMLWEDLQKVTINPQAIFAIMSDSLGKQKKTTAQISVLEVMYDKCSDKEKIAYQLSRLISKKQQYQKAYDYLLRVENRRFKNLAYYLHKAKLEMRLGSDQRALSSYYQGLKRNPADADLRRKCIHLAGQLGNVELLIDAGTPLFEKSLIPEKLPDYLLYLDGLRQNGRLNDIEALYTRLLSSSWLSKDQRGTILLHKAKALKYLGQPFKSQQILRELLAAENRDTEAAFELLDHAIAAGSTGDGWMLLNHIESGNEQLLQGNILDRDSQRYLLYLGQLLEIEGDQESAIDALKNPVAVYRTPRNKSNRPLVSELDAYLSLLYLEDGNQIQSKSIIRGYKKLRADEPDLRFSNHLVEQNGKFQVKKLIKDHDRTLGDRDLFTLAEITFERGYREGALAVAQYLVEKYPQSVRACYLVGKFGSKTGRLDVARKAFAKLHTEFPAEFHYHEQYLGVQYKLGEYQHIVTALEPVTEQRGSYTLRLLYARSLWSLGDNRKSLDSYQKLLEMPVIEKIRDAMDDRNLSFSWQEERAKLFWSLFTKVETDQLDELYSFEAEQGFLTHCGTLLGETIAEFYHQYRWERLARNEYLARKAVEENRYLAAEKQYRQTMDDTENTQGLYDLAKIYERLGDYGKEAEIYSALKKQGEAVPALDESIERNRLSRSPTLGVTYSYLKQDGRDGAINLNRVGGNINLRILPTFSSAFELDYSEFRYSEDQGDAKLNGRLILGRGEYTVQDKTKLSFGAGYHLLTDYETTFLCNARVTHQFDELLSGYISFDQNLVDDTLDSLKLGVDRKSITGGVVLKGDSGISVGSEYRRLWYSNSNQQDRLHLWTTYAIYKEFTTFEFTISSELQQNEEGNEFLGGNMQSLPYWSPDTYWKNQLIFKYHHLLKGFDTFGETPSYYTLELTAGQESDENMLYSGSFDIFLEISKKVLLKGELQYLKGEEYEEGAASLSLLYRW